MSKKSIAIGLLLTLPFVGLAPANSLQKPFVEVCNAPPSLSTAEHEYTPKPGVGVSTWRFDQGVTHNGPEDTRISVASSSLNLYDWKVARTRIPGWQDPHQSLIENDGAVAINADFFDLWGDPYPWGPIMQDGELIYFPMNYDNAQGWIPDWLKIVGEVSRIPDPANGWTTTGSVTLDSLNQSIAGLNLPALPLDGLVVYDSRRTSATPNGEVSLLISDNKIIDFDLDGKSYTPTSDQIALQATGNAARNLRNKITGREISLDIGSPESYGFSTSGKVSVGNLSTKLFAVNKNSNRTAIFTDEWIGPTPKKSLTWLISKGKVKRVFPKGASIEVADNQIVVQFVKPSLTIKSIKRNSGVKVDYSKPRIAQGFLTSGSLQVGESYFGISGINRIKGSTQINLFTSAWSGKTPKGAVTLVVKNSEIISFYNAGQAIKTSKGEYVLQIPDILAPDFRNAFHTPTTLVSVDETNERIKTISATKARYRSTLTVNGEKLVLGSLNYYRIDADKGTVFDDNYWGGAHNGETYPGNASIRIRDGLVQKINKSGGPMTVQLEGDIVVQLGGNQAPIVQDWSVGMAAVFVSKYQTKDDEPYETFMGAGNKLITDNEIVSTCATMGDGIRPRTAIGWNDSGQYWLLTASPASRDPSNSGYRTGGANYPQVAKWLKSLGATHAVGLDGGGSTWMIRRTSSGAERVDLPEPNNDGNPWIRWVPVELIIVPSDQ